MKIVVYFNNLNILIKDRLPSVATWDSIPKNYKLRINILTGLFLKKPYFLYLSPIVSTSQYNSKNFFKECRGWVLKDFYLIINKFT